MKARRACELCGGEAAVHCEPDSAYLCRACDARVHGANFLVARHPRRLLCGECGVLDPEQRRPASGALGFPPCRFVCRSCNGAYQGDGDGEGGYLDLDSDSDSESASSSCCSSSLRSAATSSCVSNAGSDAAARSGGEIAAVSSAGRDGPIKAPCSGSSGATDLSEFADRRWRAPAAARRGLDARTEAVVLIWCRRIGLDDARAPVAASRALAWGARRMTGTPFRLAAAAAVWFAARLCCAKAAAMGGRRGEGALLRRLEACAGVPAKLIVVAEARLARAVRRRHVADEGEGWAECS